MGSAVVASGSAVLDVIPAAVNAVPISVIVLGVVIFIVGFFGCCGAIRENRCFLATVRESILACSLSGLLLISAGSAVVASGSAVLEVIPAAVNVIPISVIVFSSSSSDAVILSGVLNNTDLDIFSQLNSL